MARVAAVVLADVGGVGCVDRLRKLAKRRSAWLRWLICCKCRRMVCALVAYRPGAILANVASLVECVQDSKQDNTQEGKRKRPACTGWANSCGVYVARLIPLPGVGMRGLYGILDNACSVGTACLLSMRKANTSNSKAARLYALRLFVTRCIYGGIYGRTYGALLFAHGIG